MQIRGQNSISGSNDPLVVVDGVIFMGSLNDINPNDIATYDVLKDATSAAEELDEAYTITMNWFGKFYVEKDTDIDS